MRLGAEDAFGPHFVVVEIVDALLAEHGDAELRTNDGDDGAEGEGDGEDGRGQDDVAGETAEETWVAVSQKVPDPGSGNLIAGVDVVVGAADETIEVLLEGAGGPVGAGGAEIGGGLAVEEAEVAEFGSIKGFDAGGFDLAQERIESVPVILA